MPGSASQTSIDRPPPTIPHNPTEAALRAAVQECRACELWEATQGVMGEGADHARVMLVGEQPGDREDVAGRPFVGRAGKVPGPGPRARRDRP